MGCIPACAGEARPSCLSRRPCGVHPRVCGGSGLVLCPHRIVTGASPRVRGKPSICPNRVESEGCIPACAGEAPCRSAWCGTGGVHPRVCGGSACAPARRSYRPGASPRVRGKHCRLLWFPLSIGCIPACAGEAAPVAVPRLYEGVHPRVCGGSVLTGPPNSLCTGASPRVRGKPWGVTP